MSKYRLTHNTAENNDDLLSEIDSLRIERDSLLEKNEKLRWVIKKVREDCNNMLQFAGRESWPNKYAEGVYDQSRSTLKILDSAEREQGGGDA